MQFLIRNPQSAIHNRGLTLIELLLVISLLGILAGFASLQVAPMLSRARLNRGARQIATDLQSVRMKAIAQNSRFRVTFSSGTRDYVVDKDEDGEWQRHILDAHDSIATTDAFIALPAGVSIAAVNSGGDVIFVPRGYVDAGITITLGSATEAERRRVVVNLAGRVRIE
jgi:prepilin-type N-terminal cleavage/methylation domain-containing protein